MTRISKAIEAGNINEIRQILSDRDENGVPYEDINNVHNGLTGAQTGVWYTLSCLYHSSTLKPEIACSIIDEFLNVQDDAGNPVIDLNSNHNLIEILRRIFDLYAAGKIFSSTANYLVDRVVNLRKKNGSSAYDFTTGELEDASLIAAVLTNDAHLVRTLLNLRNPDEVRTLDVNYKVDWTWDEPTALDVAYTGWFNTNKTHEDFTPNNEIIMLLKSAGARRASEILFPVVVRDLAEDLHESIKLLRELENENRVADPKGEDELTRLNSSVDASNVYAQEWRLIQEMRRRIQKIPADIPHRQKFIRYFNESVDKLETAAQFYSPGKKLPYFYKEKPWSKLINEYYFVNSFNHSIGKAFEGDIGELLNSKNIIQKLKQSANQLVVTAEEQQFDYLDKIGVPAESVSAIPLYLKSNIIKLASIISSMQNYVIELDENGRVIDAKKLAQLANQLEMKVTQFILNGNFTETDCSCFVNCCTYLVESFELNNRNTGKIAAFFIDILKYLGGILKLDVVESVFRKDGLSFFSEKTCREQRKNQVLDELNLIKNSAAL